MTHHERRHLGNVRAESKRVRQFELMIHPHALKRGRGAAPAVEMLVLVANGVHTCLATVEPESVGLTAVEILSFIADDNVQAFIEWLVALLRAKGVCAIRQMAIS